MDSSEDSIRSLAKSLRRNQRKHAELLRKVEKSSARLERRKSRLQGMEELIADQERRLCEPRREQAGKQTADGPYRHARLIFNPSSGRGDEDSGERLAEVVSALRAHGIEPHVGIKTSGKAARTIARKAVKDGYSLVVVAAGDGTIAEVAAQLVDSSTALGVVPVGTMNNVARSLGIPLVIDDACALIGMGTTRHIDVGRVIGNGPSKSEIFLECAGVGLSSVLAAAGQSLEKHRWSRLPHLLKRLGEERPGTIKVELDDVTLESSTHMVTVSNSPLLGNNLLAAPGAKMDDGLLDVHVYDGLGETDLVKLFAGGAGGHPIEMKTYRARRIRISSEEPVEVNSDMVIVRPRRVIEIEVAPGAVSMIVGNGIALSVPVEAAPQATTMGPAPPPHPNGSAEAVVEDANPSAHR
jgi:diacylglycerol kinase (ATP)